MDDPIKWNKIEKEYSNLRELFFNKIYENMDENELIYIDGISDIFDTIILDYIIDNNK